MNSNATSGARYSIPAPRPLLPIIVYALLSMLFFYSEITWGESHKTIVFATPARDDPTLEQHYNSVYTEAFKRMGYGFELVRSLGKRAVYDANAGAVDGDAGRILELQQGGAYPNLRRVDVAIASLPLVAYAVDPNIKIHGWKNLINSGYKIVYIRGIRITEINLPRVLPEEDIIEVTDPSQAFGMILRNRADMIIWSENTLLKVAKSEAYRDHKFYRAGFLEDMVLYPYLHKKHENLVPKLVMVLRRMKEEGVFQPLIQFH